MSVIVAATVLALLVFARPAAGQSRPGSEWEWPVSAPIRVVAGFDPPAHPWLPGHRGVDLAANPGDSVFAAGSGLVAFAGHIAGKGVVVVVHRNGLRTTYEPVDPLVSPGAHVSAGESIGHIEAGLSHCGMKPWCLHWGLRRGLTYLDPLTLVSDRRPILLPVDEVGPWSAAGLDASPNEILTLGDANPAQEVSRPNARGNPEAESRSNSSREFVVGAGAAAIGALGVGASRRLRRRRVRSSSSH